MLGESQNTVGSALSALFDFFFFSFETTFFYLIFNSFFGEGGERIRISQKKKSHNGEKYRKDV